MLRRERLYPPETREQARELRKSGLSYSEIIAELGNDIPQPTLQGWVKDIQLTTEQRARIKQKELEGARQAQPLGAQWNREQKQKRLQAARDEALPIAKRLAEDRDALRLMAAVLYVGEGSKTDDQFSFGNSDPKVIKAWVALLRRNFELDESKFRCQLHISEGMDEECLKQYWSSVTNIPLTQFIRGTLDKRIVKKERQGYKGVCVVHYYSLSIKRFLDALVQGVIDELLQNE